VKVVVLQGQLTHFRIPFFNALACHPEIDSVEVIHSGEPIISAAEFFAEVCVPATNWHGVRWQQFPASVKDADLVVTPLDLHWLNYLSMPWRMPTTLWGHGYGKTKFLNPLRTFLARKCRSLILYGDRARDDFINRGIDPQKIFVAHNTLHIPNAGIATSATRNSLIFVGRLQPRKRIEEILYAFSRLPESARNELYIQIVGDGPERTTLNGIADRCGVADRVIFHGAVYDAEALAKIFASAWAYVSTGWTGLGLLHAFAYGVPGIINGQSAHAPEVENLKHEQNGIFYTNGVVGLSDAIRWITSDQDRWQALSYEAFRTYQDRTIERMANEYVLALQYAVRTGN
jgi:glycosyltransferase involved in cell wall biosynthesis